MNHRQKSIVITLYNEKKWLLGKTLAKLFQVSDRTIRNDISQIKEKLGASYIVTSKKQGYSYNMEYPLPVETENHEEFEESRLAMLVKRFLMGESVDIYHLSETVYMSESTIQKDIQWLRGYFEELLGLDAVIHSSAGIYQLNATKISKIELLTRIVKHDTMITADSLISCFSEVEGEKIQSIVSKLIPQFQIPLKYFDEKLLVTQLIYATAFYQKNWQLQEFVTHCAIQDRFMASLFDQILNEAGYPIPVEMKLAIEREYKKVVEMTIFESEVTIDFILADNLFHEIIAILEEIHHIYLLDFTKSSRITGEMTRHIFLAIERSKRGIVLKKQPTNIVAQEYSYLLDIAIFIGEKILERLDVVLNQEELLLLVMYLYQLNREIETKHQLGQALRVALIVFEGQATLYYLQEKLRDLFEQYNIEIIEITDNAQYELLLKKNVDVDFCLSTRNVKLPENVPLLILSESIGLIDEARIKRQFSLSLIEKKKKRFKYIKEKYLHEELFVFQHDFNQKYETIETLSYYCIEKSYTELDFAEKLYDREQLFSTEIPTGVALPHPIKHVAKKCGILFCFLRKTSKWDSHKIKVVIIPLIEESHGEDAPLINNFLSLISSQKSTIEKLHDCKSYTECIKLLETIYINND